MNEYTSTTMLVRSVFIRDDHTETVLRHKFKVVYIFLYGYVSIYVDHGPEYVFRLRSVGAAGPCYVVVHSGQ